MAGDWIKMRASLQTHPKVVTLMSHIKCDKHTVIGALHAAWSVFDEHTEDGTLEGYTPFALDQVIGREGFSEALIAVGWLAYDGDQTLFVPEFGEHNGASAKRRVEATKRKQMSRKKCDKSVTREEKRREESKRGDSVSKDTGASAPIYINQKESPEPDDDDPTKALWDMWLKVVGATPANRGILGRAISEHGEEKVREAVAATVGKKPADPISYFRGCLKPRRLVC